MQDELPVGSTHFFCLDYMKISVKILHTNILSWPRGINFLSLFLSFSFSSDFGFSINLKKIFIKYSSFF